MRQLLAHALVEEFGRRWKPVKGSIQDQSVFRAESVERSRLPRRVVLERSKLACRIRGVEPRSRWLRQRKSHYETDVSSARTWARSWIVSVRLVLVPRACLPSRGHDHMLCAIPAKLGIGESCIHAATFAKDHYALAAYASASWRGLPRRKKLEAAGQMPCE